MFISTHAFDTALLDHMVAQQDHTHHQQSQNKRSGHSGMLGDTPMSQEGSGTSWLPASSPHYALMLPMNGAWTNHLMGTAFAGFTDAGGKRGDSQAYINSMTMYMAKKESRSGTLGVHAMVSLDPLTNGKSGVPNLFQTGEGLVDRQHPHDLIAEAALSFSAPISKGARAFLYGGPIAEPALGATMFMHRPSGFEVPEAPISHHWFDSTHISFGVLTGGLTFTDKWKFEVGAFNGHEPDDDRYGIDPIALNSASTRLTYNPTPNWSFCASYGYLNSPESSEPGVDVHRLTASAMVSQPLGARNLSAALLFGRNIKEGSNSDAWAFEGTLSDANWSTFLRWENVMKDELTGVPTGSHTICKAIFGATKNILVRGGFEYGIGAYVGAYSIPSDLEPAYGKNPLTFGIFFRMRPTKM